jgi:hypothetical protein
MQTPYGNSPPAQQGYPSSQPFYPSQPGYPSQPSQQAYAAPQASPRQGHAPPQGCAMQSQAIPPYALPTGAGLAQRTLWGTPLEPGERVFYYHRINRTPARIGLALCALVVIPLFGLGLYFLYTVIFDRKREAWAQAMTNRRLITWNGKGAVRWSIRWEEIFGTNKVTQNGYMTGMGVRNRAQQQFLFNDDCPTVERVLMQALETPRLRETAPEMAFDPQVV